MLESTEVSSRGSAHSAAEPGGVFDQAPAVTAPLDQTFRPLYGALRAHRQAVGNSGCTLTLALERDGGAVSRFSLPVFADGHARLPESQRLAERVLKFLLWQRGGHHVFVAGSPAIAEYFAERYRPGGERAFDAEFFAKIYEQPSFVIEAVAEADLPVQSEQGKAIGGHLDGCRIGFDAGGSDRKVAAVIDGKQVFSVETVWQPKLESDPDYHFNGIDDSIRQAAAHLPRIDAIGVSSAGIYVDNRTRIASLFRQVPEAAFAARITSSASLSASASLSPVFTHGSNAKPCSMLSTSYRPYVIDGEYEIARFPGIVHGVVVQITTETFRSSATRAR